MTLKLLTCLFIGVVSIAHVSAETPKAVKKAHTLLNTYIESFLSNDYDKLKSILAKDATVRFNSASRIVSYNGKDFLNHFKSIRDVDQQGCKVDYKIVSETERMLIAEIDIQYQEVGLQKNFIMIGKNKKGEWKIVDLYKVFEKK